MCHRESQQADGSHLTSPCLSGACPVKDVFPLQPAKWVPCSQVDTYWQTETGGKFGAHVCLSAVQLPRGLLAAACAITIVLGSSAGLVKSPAVLKSPAAPKNSDGMQNS